MAEKSCGLHKLVADVALLAEGHVLMVRYRDTSKYDNQSGWFLPDDFLAHLEHPDDAAKRIVRIRQGSRLRAFGSIMSSRSVMVPSTWCFTAGRISSRCVPSNRLAM